MRASVYKDMAAAKQATVVHHPTKVFDKEGNCTLIPCACVWCAACAPVVMESARPAAHETSAVYDEGLELVQQLDDGGRLIDKLDARAAALCRQLQKDLSTGCPPRRLAAPGSEPPPPKPRARRGHVDDPPAHDEAAAPRGAPSPVVRFDFGGSASQAPAPPPLPSPSSTRSPVQSVSVRLSPLPSPERLSALAAAVEGGAPHQRGGSPALPPGISALRDDDGAPFSLAGVRKHAHPRHEHQPFVEQSPAAWKEPIRFPATPPASPGAALGSPSGGSSIASGSLAPELSVSTINF